MNWITHPQVRIALARKEGTRQLKSQFVGAIHESPLQPSSGGEGN